MRHRPIALLAALSLVYSLAHGGTEEERPGTVPAFLDSFGLNSPLRPPATRESNVPSPVPAPLPPSADSFGLNRLLTSAAGGCPAAGGKVAARIAKGAPRCIEI